MSSDFLSSFLSSTFSSASTVSACLASDFFSISSGFSAKTLTEISHLISL
jgi:hypothetical protein